MDNKDNKGMSLLERMKARTTNVKSEYEFKETNAKNAARECPHCGAGRGDNDGLLYCAYCGFEFIKTDIDDGIYMHAERRINSK